jgi:hypothetical protein
LHLDAMHISDHFNDHDHALHISDDFSDHDRTVNDRANRELSRAGAVTISRQRQPVVLGRALVDLELEIAQAQRVLGVLRVGVGVRPWLEVDAAHPRRSALQGNQQRVGSPLRDRPGVARSRRAT